MSTKDRDKIMDEFIDLIPVLRTRLGITQIELADRVGITRQAMVYIEGKKRPLMWSVFLSIFFIFFLEPKTRPFLVASGVIDTELSKTLFEDSSTLAQAASLLESDKPILTKTKEMMDSIIKNKV